MQLDVRAGQVLAGKYEVEREIGAGGMGVVVVARHLQLEDKVAIKFLRPEAMTSPEVVGRFAREARAARRIQSDHVARVSDVGTLEGGEPYMVMEYLEGSDMSRWLREHGALPVEQAVELVLQACEAIAEAHTLGIVHRDLKPANLFVVQRAGLPFVKVLDFGISKVSPSGSASDAHLTSTAAVMGTPLYMPPEQMLASKGVDARADIWALGVILFELLAASAPFRGETVPEVCMKIASEPPPPLLSFRSDVPPELEAIIGRCLEKNRERRYPSIAELAVALGAFGSWRSRTSVDRVLRTFDAAGLSAGQSQAPAVAVALPSSGSASSPEVTAAAPMHPETVLAETNAPWGRTATGANKPRISAKLFSAGVAAAVALGGLGAWLVRGTPSTASSPAATASAHTTAVIQGAAPSAGPAPAEPAELPAPPAEPADPSIAAPPTSAPAVQSTRPKALAPAAVVQTAAPPKVAPKTPVWQKTPAPKHQNKTGMTDER